MTDPRIREEFDVGGVRLPRSFKILRLGHFAILLIPGMLAVSSPLARGYPTAPAGTLV
jgi:hypothetical protein